MSELAPMLRLDLWTLVAARRHGGQLVRVAEHDDLHAAEGL